MLGGWNWSHLTGLGNCEMKNLVTRLQLVSSKDLFALKHLLSRWILDRGSIPGITALQHRVALSMRFVIWSKKTLPFSKYIQYIIAVYGVPSV